MILINVRFKPLPENTENFRELVADFTDASVSYTHLTLPTKA